MLVWCLLHVYLLLKLHSDWNNCLELTQTKFSVFAGAVFYQGHCWELPTCGDNKKQIDSSVLLLLFSSLEKMGPLIFCILLGVPESSLVCCCLSQNSGFPHSPSTRGLVPRPSHFPRELTRFSGSNVPQFGFVWYFLKIVLTLAFLARTPRDDFGVILLLVMLVSFSLFFIFFFPLVLIL